MQKSSNKIKEAVGTIVKPVVSLTEKFNVLMKKLEQKTSRNESVAEVDGFVNKLLEEAKDAEKGLFAFFGEMLFIHHLSESMASLENELTLVEILGEQTFQFLKPAFVGIYMNRPEKNFIAAYQHPSEMNIPWDSVKDLAEENFPDGEAMLSMNKRLNRKFFSLLIVPLRTTSEKLGIMVVGKKGRGGNFLPNEVSLVIAGASLISFMLSNMKLHQKILKDEKLVAIGNTIAGLSHDIKNMLNNLEGGQSLLEIGVDEKDFDTIRTGMGIINRSYERMKSLVLSMIDYSRERELESKQMDLNGLIEEIISSNSEIFESGKITVLKDLDSSIPEIYLDPSRMDRLLTNLLSNAVDAVEKKKGKITIGTKFFPEKNMVHIRVEDNGCGIPQGALDKIFDLFYSTKSRGTGFGLAIVQKIVKEHNGTIEVHSKEGKGTTFLIKLPAKHEKQL